MDPSDGMPNKPFRSPNTALGHCSSRERYPAELRHECRSRHLLDYTSGKGTVAT